VNYSDPNVTSAVTNLVNNLLTINDTLLGLNPLDVLTRFGTLNGTNVTNYLYYAVPANTTGVSTLVLPGGSVSRRAFRFLQTSTNVFNLNTASPSVQIPMNITNAINYPGLSYSLAAIRNPESMMNSVDNYIHSQVVAERAYLGGNTKNGYNFTNAVTNLTVGNNTTNYTPANASFLTITLPWAYAPFNLKNNATYLNSCKVFRYNGTSFVPTNTCILVNTTDQNRAVLNCLNLDIIGVGCGQNSSNVVLTATGNTGNGGTTGTGVNGNNNSSGRIRFASIVAVLILLVL